MADLTRNAPLRVWGQAHTLMVPMNGGAAITGYKGGPLIFDADVDTDAAVLFTSGVTAAAGDVVVGIAAEPVSVAAADADGAVEVESYVYPTVLGFQSSVFALANAGDDVFMDDSGTLTATGTGNIKVGTVHWVAEGYVYVRLSAPYVLAAADVA